MSSETQQPEAPRVFSREGVPIIGTFLVWGTGSGAQTLARPLFAFDVAGSVFLVTVLIAALAGARMIAGPLTGYLADHWGRKPMAVTGAFIRGTASGLVIFTDNYAQFFVLEFIGAIGVAMWQTTSQVIVADMSTPATRGRAVATRNTTLRLGQILGPVLGGVVAAVWSLQAVFLINAVSKYVVMIVTWRMVKETRPEVETRRKLDAESGVTMRSVMASRAFAVLAITTVAVAMMNQGVFMTLFPIVAGEEGGLDTATIGTLVGFASFITLLISFPNGIMVDRWGRKRSLVPGLALAAGAAVLLGLVVDFRTAVQAAAVFGVAQAMMMGANMAFAMDLAPAEKRGAFLGVFTAVQSFGALIGPLAVGGMVAIWGFAFAFNVVAVFMVAAALVMAFLGPETKGQAK